MPRKRDSAALDEQAAENPEPMARPKRSTRAKNPAYADYVLDKVEEEQEEQEVEPPSRKTSKKAKKDKGRGTEGVHTREGAHATEVAHDDTEKRVDKHGHTVMYRSTMSADVAARVERALSVGAGAAHRLYLLDTKQVTPPSHSSGGSQEFSVLGATGNVYTVNICRHPSCTCPDFRGRGNVCKHILFCYLRVLRCARTDAVIWQKALLPSEVSRVLGGLDNGGGVDQTALAAACARQAYAAATGKTPLKGAKEAEAAETDEKPPEKPKRPVEGDCPICYEEMSAAGEPVCTCETCGNHAHKGCFDRWSSAKRTSGSRVTCVWCRALWAAPGGGAGPSTSAAAVSGVRVGTTGMGGRYLNLAGAAGIHVPSSYDLYSGRTADYVERYGY